MLKPCIDCGTPTTNTRCRQHDRNREPERRARQAPHWRRLRAEAVEAHLATHGAHCPGWNVPPHPAAPDDLTGDLIAGSHATATPQQLRVLCRSCNARRGSPHRAT